MAQISVKPGSLLTQEAGLLAIANKLRLVEMELNTIKIQVSYYNSSEVYRSLAGRIGNTASAIGKQRTSVSSMKNTLGQVRRIYTNTERQVEDTFHQKSDVDWKQSTNSGTEIAISVDEWNSNWKSFWEDIKNKGEFEDAFREAAIGITGGIFGKEISAEIKSKILNFKVDPEAGAKWDFDEGEAKLFAKLKAEGNAAELSGETRYGIFGLRKRDGSIAALVGATSGEAYFALMKDGKFQPGVGLGAEAEGSVVQGKTGHQVGTDELNYHGELEGDLVGGEAKAGVKFGKDGISAKAGLEGYLAKGEITGGFEFFGIVIDVSAEGKAGALGATAGGSMTGTSAEAELGASALLGLGLKVKVDWSDFSKKMDDWMDDWDFFGGGW